MISENCLDSFQWFRYHFSCRLCCYHWKKVRERRREKRHQHHSRVQPTGHDRNFRKESLQGPLQLHVQEQLHDRRIDYPVIHQWATEPCKGKSKTFSGEQANYAIYDSCSRHRQLITQSFRCDDVMRECFGIHQPVLLPSRDQLCTGPRFLSLRVFSHC